MSDITQSPYPNCSGSTYLNCMVSADAAITFEGFGGVWTDTEA